MMFRTLHLHARIRAICMIFALLLVPDIVQAEDVYLLTAETINGTTGTYSMPINHKFTNSGTEYTFKITSMPATGFSFRIGVKGWENNMQPYKDGDALPIDGSYTISDNCWGHDKAWKVSYTDGEYSSLTITVDLKEGNRYVKIIGTKSGSSSGGGKVLPPVTRALTTAILSRRPLAMVFPTISVALSYATIRAQNLRKVISTTGKIISA